MTKKIIFLCLTLNFYILLTMFISLLPLCTIPLFGMILSTMLYPPIPSWYLMTVFGYNMMKSIFGAMGLCLTKTSSYKPYFAVFYFVFLLADVVCIPIFIYNLVTDPTIFIVCFVAATVAAYVPITIVLLQKTKQKSWKKYFLFQHNDGQPIGRWFITLSSLWSTGMVLFVGYMFQLVSTCMDYELMVAWFSGLMLIWLMLLITCFLSIAACVPFRRAFLTNRSKSDMYSPLTMDIVHIDPANKHNKNCLYGCFGATFALQGCMLGFQVVALQLFNPMQTGLNQTCVENLLMNNRNTSFMFPMNVSTNMLSLDVMILVVPCLVFGFFNFLRVCIS